MRGAEGEMKKMLGLILGAVAALCAGIVFSAFGGALLILNGLTTVVLPSVFFVAVGINVFRAFRRIFPRGGRP